MFYAASKPDHNACSRGGEDVSSKIKCHKTQVLGQTSEKHTKFEENPEANRILFLFYSCLFLSVTYFVPLTNTGKDGRNDL